MKSIPFFYADLIARMFPGGVFLALLQMNVFEWPDSWSNFCKNTDGSVVMCPLIFAGLAYMIGTLFEVLLNPKLEDQFTKAFETALKSHLLVTDDKEDLTDTKSYKDIKDLSRATFGLLIVTTNENEREAVSHLIRFHSEAKMTFSIAWIFGIWITIIMLDECLKWQFISIGGNLYCWVLGSASLIYFLYKVTMNRLESRARFMFRTIERFKNEIDNKEFKRIYHALIKHKRSF